MNLDVKFKNCRKDKKGKYNHNQLNHVPRAPTGQIRIAGKKLMMALHMAAMLCLKWGKLRYVRAKKLKALRKAWMKLLEVVIFEAVTLTKAWKMRLEVMFAAVALIKTEKVLQETQPKTTATAMQVQRRY
jgi:hypothetical protein